MLLNCGVGEDSWESLGLQGVLTSPFWRRSALGFLWRQWCQSCSLATSCEGLTHWKWPWCLGGTGAEGEGDDRGWDGWMSSWTRWAWVWVNSGSWWWTGRPGVLRFMGSQRVGHDWATELNWTELNGLVIFPTFFNLSLNMVIRTSWSEPVSSWSCFCWLCRASPFLVAKNIINLISVLTIWWCPCVESSLVLLEEGVCYD